MIQEICRNQCNFLADWTIKIPTPRFRSTKVFPHNEMLFEFLLKELKLVDVRNCEFKTADKFIDEKLSGIFGRSWLGSKRKHTHLGISARMEATDSQKTETVLSCLIKTSPRCFMHFIKIRFSWSIQKKSIALSPRQTLAKQASDGN